MSRHRFGNDAFTPFVHPLKAKAYDLKAVNPNRKPIEDTRTPEDLLAIIEEKGREIEAAVADLRATLRMRSDSRINP